MVKKSRFWAKKVIFFRFFQFFPVFGQIFAILTPKTEKISQNPVFRAIFSPKSPKLSILEHFQILKNFVVFYVKLHEKVRFDPHS